MITISDIGEIIYDHCKDYGVDIYISGNVPTCEIDAERIVIIPKSLDGGKYWLRCFVEVNWLVPDIHDEGDLIRIKEIEKLMASLEYGCGSREGRNYKFKQDSKGIERETDMRCHIVNVRLLFNIQNIL